MDEIPLTFDKNPPEDLPLQFVGILKFIDQRVLVALPQRRCERAAAVLVQRAREPREHVIIVELSVFALVFFHPRRDSWQKLVGYAHFERKRGRLVHSRLTSQKIALLMSVVEKFLESHVRLRGR